MSIKKIIEKTDYNYVIWLIIEAESDMIKLLQPTKHELGEINTINHILRKKQNMAARISLNYLAKKKVKLKYKENGAPYCDEFKHISISHSKQYSMVLTSDNVIGIDIQAKIENIENIKSKFINTTDNIEITKDNVTNLHLAWCFKEAIYKTRNESPISMKMDINLNLTKNRGQFKIKESMIDYNLKYDILENYFITMAKKIL
tara:strand:- start:27 stop:635 length:609 start_codon:yes stop_codon:yes gene_type:complete